MELTIDKLTIEQVKQFNPELFKSIQESTDPNEEIKTLKDKLEAETTTNQTLSQDNDNLRKEVEDLKKENGDLKGKNDNYEAEKNLAAKKETVDSLLEEAKLPKEIVTDYFREGLLALDEEGIKKAIDDRKHIAEATKGKVTESGDEFANTQQKEGAPTEEDKKKVIGAVRG